MNALYVCTRARTRSCARHAFIAMFVPLCGAACHRCTSWVLLLPSSCCTWAPLPHCCPGAWCVAHPVVGAACIPSGLHRSQMFGVWAPASATSWVSTCVAVVWPCSHTVMGSSACSTSAAGLNRQHPAAQTPANTHMLFIHHSHGPILLCTSCSDHHIPLNAIQLSRRGASAQQSTHTLNSCTYKISHFTPYAGPHLARPLPRPGFPRAPVPGAALRGLGAGRAAAALRLPAALLVRGRPRGAQRVPLLSVH